MWRLSASGGAQNLSLRLNTEDKNRLFAAQGLVPNQARLAKREECTKFLQWRAFVLSRTDRKKTLAVNGCPLSAYYSRGLAQTSFNMSTQIPLSKAKALDGDYCTKEEPSLLVRIEFLNVQDLGMMSDYPTLDFERFQLYHTREGLKRCLKQNELLVKELESLHGRLSSAMKENRNSKDLVTDFQKLLKSDNLNGDASKLLPAHTPTSRPASICSSPTLNAQPPVPRPRGQRGPPPRPPPRAYSPVVTDLVNARQFTYNAPTPMTSAGAPAPSPGSPSPTAATPPPSRLQGPSPAPSHQGPPPASSAGLGVAIDQHRLAVLNSNDTAFKRFSFTGINITAAMISQETSETSKKVHEEVPAQSSSGGKEPESPLRQQKQQPQQQQPPPRPLLPPQGQPTQHQQQQQRDLQQHKQHLLQQQKELQQQLQQQKQNLQLHQQNQQQQQQQQRVHPQENGKPHNGSQASPVVMSKMGNDGTARGFALARMTRPPVSTSTSQPRTNPQSPSPSPSPQSPTPSPSPSEDTSNRLSWPQGLSIQTPQTSQSTGALHEGVKSPNAQHTKQDPPKLSNGDIGTKSSGLSNGFQSNLQQAVSSPNIASSNSGSQSKEPGSSPKRRPLTSPTHRPTSSPPEIPSGFSFSPVPVSVLNRKSPVPEPRSPHTRSSQVSASANQQGQQGQRNPSWPTSLPLPQNSVSQSSDSSLNQASIPESVVSRDPASQQNAVREEATRHAKSTPNTPNLTSRPVSELASISTPTSPNRQNGLPNGHRQQNGSPLHLPPPPQPPQLPPPLKPTRLPEPLEPTQVPQLPPPPSPPPPPTSQINDTQQELVKINGGVTTPSQVEPTQNSGTRTPASPVPRERVTSPTGHVQQQQFQQQFNKLHQQQLKHQQQHHHQPHPLQQEVITKTATGNGAVINNNNMATILDKTHQQKQHLPGYDAVWTNGTNGRSNGTNGMNGANGTNGIDRTDNGRTPSSSSSVSSPPTSPPPVTVVRRKQQTHTDRMEDLSKRLSIPSVEERQRMGIVETSL